MSGPNQPELRVPHPERRWDDEMRVTTMKRLQSLHLSLLFVASLCLSAIAAEKRGFRPDDVYLLQSVADPQVSPDGKLVAYTATHVDKAKNRRVSSVWLVPTDGSAAPRDLKGAQSGRSPRWSPDG